MTFTNVELNAASELGYISVLNLYGVTDSHKFDLLIPQDKLDRPAIIRKGCVGDAMDVVAIPGIDLACLGFLSDLTLDSNILYSNFELTNLHYYLDL